MRKTYVVCSLLCLGCIVCAAVFSYGFYEFDEHFQVLEFLSMKLGKALPSDLAWEYSHHSRQWIQPFLYFCIAKPLVACGVKDFLVLGFLLRLCTGLFVWVALSAYVKAAANQLASDNQKKLFISASFLLWFIPYLAVRTSSETGSSSMFMLGLALLLPVFYPEGDKGEATKVMNRQRAVFLAGCCLGLSFELRYQVCAALLGLFAWLVCIRRLPWKMIAVLGAGILLSCVIGMMVDLWGYGGWTFVPWLYFKAGLLQGVAAKFGTAPFYAYPFILLKNPMAPLVIVIMLAYIVAWIRYPSHVLTWITLPYFILHCCIGHKEVRFMFFLAMLSPLFLAMTFYSHGAMSWLQKKRYAAVRFALYGLNGAGLITLCIFPLNSDSQMQHFIARNFKQGFECCTVDYDPFVIHNVQATFYRPAPYVVHYVKDFAVLEDTLRRRSSEIYFTTYQQRFPREAAGIEKNARCLYAAVSLRRRAYMRLSGLIPALQRIMKWDGKVRRLYLLRPMPLSAAGERESYER